MYTKPYLIILLGVIAFSIIANASSVLVVGDDPYTTGLRLNNAVADGNKVYAYGFVGRTPILVVFNGTGFTGYALTITINGYNVPGSYYDRVKVFNDVVVVYGSHGYVIALNKSNLTDIIGKWRVEGLVKDVWYNGTSMIVLSTARLNWLQNKLVITKINFTSGNITSVEYLPAKCFSNNFTCLNYKSVIYNGTHIIAITLYGRIAIYNGSILYLANLPPYLNLIRFIEDGKYAYGGHYILNISSGKLYNFTIANLKAVGSIAVDGRDFIVAGLLNYREGDIFVLNITSNGTVAYYKMLEGYYWEFRPVMALNGTHILLLASTRSWGTTNEYGDEDWLGLAVQYSDAPYNITFNFSTSPPTNANVPLWTDSPIPVVSTSTITLKWLSFYKPTSQGTPLNQSTITVAVSKITLSSTWTAGGTVSILSLLRQNPLIPPPPIYINPFENQNPGTISKPKHIEKHIEPVKPYPIPLPVKH